MIVNKENILNKIEKAIGYLSEINSISKNCIEDIIGDLYIDFNNVYFNLIRLKEDLEK